MKKTKLTRALLLTSAALCLCTSLSAQGGFNFHIIVQPQSVMMSGDFKIYDQTSTTTDNYIPLSKSFTFGFAGGIGGEYHFNDNMGVSVGILYSSQGQDYDELTQQGSKTDSFGVFQYTNTSNVSTSLNYLKIPIQFNYNTDPSASVSFTCYGGLYLGFLLSYKVESTQDYTETSVYGTYNFNSTFTAKGETANTTGSESLIGSSYNYGQSFNDTYNILSSPYNTFDVGATMGAGLQIRWSDNLYLPILFTYEVGFTNTKNESSQALQTNGSGNSTEFFWGDTNNPNRTSESSNSTVGLRFGIKMLF